MRTIILLAAALLAGAALAHDTGSGEPVDISKVNSAVRAEAGQRYGSLSTVNGSIRVEKGAQVDSAKTVNGSVTIEDQAQVGSLQTVNGAIRIGREVVVDGDIAAVNGSINAGPGSRISGNLENVNGSMNLEQVEIGGDMITVNGRLTLARDVHLAGGITVRKPGGIRWFGWGARTPARITIGPGSSVDGPLRFEQEVELYVHDSARIGPVTGAEVVRFSGDTPD